MTTSQRQHADSLTQLNARLDQLRLEIRETLVESTSTVQTVVQDALGLGQGLERIRHALFDVAMDKLEGIDLRFQKAQEQVEHIFTATDRKFNEICTSVGRLIDEQGDNVRRHPKNSGRISSMDGCHAT